MASHASVHAARTADARVHRITRRGMPSRHATRVVLSCRAASSEEDTLDPTTVVVAVVTTSSCPHCRRAKTAMTAAGIAFEEIDASSPDGIVLDAARQLSGMRTVPQVFVGGTCYGGADDVEVGIGNGDLAREVDDAGARARREGDEPVPAAIRDAIRDAKAAMDDAAANMDDVAVVDGDDTSIDSKHYEKLERMCERMASEVAPRDAWVFAGFPAWPPVVKERAVVSGDDVVKWLDANNDDEGEGSIQTARALMEAGLVASVGLRGHGFDGADGTDAWRASLFRLSDHACVPTRWPELTPGCINARRRWRGSNRRPARYVARDLRARITSLYDEFLSPDGTYVDYAGMYRSPKFAQYVDAAAELQTVDLRSLTRDEKIAFFVNVYNAMIVHVTCVVGPPSGGFFDKLTFFNRYRYDIGGYAWSCDDIEHGALRGNRPGAASVGAILGKPKLSPGPFASDDPRRAFTIEPMDPRVHFALVCGAKSCPPIRTYTGEGLESQLDAAAEAFVTGDVEIVDDSNSTVRCSKIIGEWYAEDFGTDDTSRLRWMSRYLPLGSTKREEVDAILGGGGEVKLETAEYDWTLNGEY